MDKTADLTYARSGGVLIGLGMGGFVDGILIHQILQWHHMRSTIERPDTLAAMQTNVFWDGLFHAFTWTVTLLGILLLWAGARRAKALPTATWLIGLMSIGWGTFNLIEGTVNHHILGIHHVRSWGPDPLWDLGFLLSGPLLIGLGWWMTRSHTAAGP